jgi:hypothetical protein
MRKMIKRMKGVILIAISLCILLLGNIVTEYSRNYGVINLGSLNKPIDLRNRGYLLVEWIANSHKKSEVMASELVTCGGLAVTIFGTSDDDVLTGTSEVDVIHGMEGNDTINGLGGDDVICGGPGRDIVSGGDGNDKLYGQGGDDTLKGGAGRDKLYGGQGADVIKGGSGKDILNGDDGDDSLDGGNGDDSLDGGDGDDICEGGEQTVGNISVNCEATAQVTLSFSEPINLSNNSGDSLRPRVATNSVGHLFVVWTDNSAGKHQIFLSKSLDGGATWSAPSIVPAASGVSRRPELEVWGLEEIYVVWELETAWGDTFEEIDADIYFSRSIDGGMTWSTAVNLSNTPGTHSSYASISTHADGGINVVWAEEVPEVGDVFFTRSTDYGVTWTMPLNISREPPTP